eukprot:365611-Chlamydomonas_euryale.AAC.1
MERIQNDTLYSGFRALPVCTPARIVLYHTAHLHNRESQGDGGVEPLAYGSASDIPVHQALGFPSKGGLFQERAVQLLQDFYVNGNPAAPRPHRPLRNVPVART